MRMIRSVRAAAPAELGRSRRILAVVGDTQVGLWVVRSLGRAGLTVFSVCRSEHGLPAYSRYSCGAWQSEKTPRDAGFAEEVLSLARELNVGSIMTIAESYHAVLMRERRRFEPDIRLFSPPADCFSKATDKGYLHETARRLGIPVAGGMTLDRLMSGSEGRALRFPLVMRTSKQNTRNEEAPWKAAYANDEDELERIYQSVHGIASNVLVQEYHPGVEDHVQVLMHRGEAFMVGEYIGEHHMPLAGGVTVQRVTCRHENVINDAVRLLQEIGWEGVAGVQFHYDPATGEYISSRLIPGSSAACPRSSWPGLTCRFSCGRATLSRRECDTPLIAWACGRASWVAMQTGCLG
jgi:predicted ATP-grasp superfamily ATP-dependent carboligase